MQLPGVLYKWLAASAVMCSFIVGCGGSGSSNVVTPLSVQSPQQATATPTLAPSGNGFSVGLRQTLDQTVQDLRTQMNVPGVMVRLTVPGVGVYSTLSGVSNLANGAPLQTNQYFRIGSLTKTFTVTALLQLADEGRLSLDDPISKYFPGFPRPNATLLELANMSSGLASYTFDPDFQRALFQDPHRIWTPQETIDIGAADTLAGCAPQTRACFEPGTSFYYCDTNTIMLGLVIQQVSGQPYATVLQQKIFAPLHLTHTSVEESGLLPSPHVHGYTPQGLSSGIQDATDWVPSYAFAVGDMVSTLDDLDIWLPALAKGTLLKPSTQAARLLANPFSASPARFYAVGIASEHGWLGHTGAVFGYNIFPYSDPQSGATVIVLTNQDVAVLKGQGVEPATVIARAVVNGAAAEAPIPVLLP